MTIQEFEKEAIHWICRETYSPEILDGILSSPERIEVKDAGAGQYDLNIYHSDLSSDLIVCEDNMFGAFEAVKVGFVVTISNKCLGLECYTVGDTTIPANIRQGEVALSKT